MRVASRVVDRVVHLVSVCVLGHNNPPVDTEIVPL